MRTRSGFTSSTILKRHQAAVRQKNAALHFRCVQLPFFSAVVVHRAAAQASGFFAQEITPVSVPAGKRDETVEFGLDEHARPDTTLEALTRLKPLFGADGTVTVGNAAVL